MIPSLRQRRKAHPLFKLTEEVRTLHQRMVHQDIYSRHKDEAHAEYINKRISEINAAIKSTNGMRRGETPEQYQARLVEANKKR